MCMAYVTKKVQMRYIELGNYIAEYNDGDVIILDSVKDITPLYPIKPDSVLVSVCCKGWHKMNVNGRSYELTEGSLFLCPSNARVVVGEHSSNFQSKVLCLSDQSLEAATTIPPMRFCWHFCEPCFLSFVFCSKE